MVAFSLLRFCIYLLYLPLPWFSLVACCLLLLLALHLLKQGMYHGQEFIKDFVDIQEIICPSKTFLGYGGIGSQILAGGRISDANYSTWRSRRHVEVQTPRGGQKYRRLRQTKDSQRLAGNHHQPAPHPPLSRVLSWQTDDYVDMDKISQVRLSVVCGSYR